MFKTLDLKYYKIEVNDESKETKCTQIVICGISNQTKKNIAEIFKQILKTFWNWKELQSSIWLG